MQKRVPDVVVEPDAEDPGGAVAEQGLDDDLLVLVAERPDRVAVAGDQRRWLRFSIFLDGFGMKFYNIKISFVL